LPTGRASPRERLLAEAASSSSFADGFLGRLITDHQDVDVTVCGLTGDVERVVEQVLAGRRDPPRPAARVHPTCGGSLARTSPAARTYPKVRQTLCGFLLRVSTRGWIEDDGLALELRELDWVDP
jgi:hypothetical protein